MQKPMRFALIGCGLVGPAHARSMGELDDAELAVVVSRNEEKGRAFAEEFGTEWCGSYEEVLARPDVDAVDICTPPDTHLVMVKAAAEAGKQVLTEKPMEITVDRARQVTKVCEEAGVTLGVIFQSRFKKTLRSVKGILDSGLLGRLIEFDTYVKWWRPQAYYDGGDWKGGGRAASAGALANQGAHYIDVLLWLAGDARKVYAKTRTANHEMTGEDLALAMLEFKNGALGVVQIGTAYVPGTAERMEIHGEKGAILIDEGRVTKFHVEGVAPDELPPIEEEETGTGASDPMAFPITWHQGQIQDFVDAVVEGRKPAIDGDEGIRSLRLIEAIYQSSDTGQEVTLD